MVFIKGKNSLSGGCTQLLPIQRRARKNRQQKRAGTDQVDATEETEEETKHPAKIESVYFECNEKRLDLQKCESRDGWIHFPSCHPDGDDFEGDE